MGRGHTYDPHSIERHLGMELRYHVLPPVKGLRVGEIGEGGESRPNLNKSPERRTSPRLTTPQPCQASASSRAAASLLANADMHQQTPSPTTNKPHLQCLGAGGLQPWEIKASPIYIQSNGADEPGTQGIREL